MIEVIGTMLASVLMIVYSYRKDKKHILYIYQTNRYNKPR